MLAILIVALIPVTYALYRANSLRRRRLHTRRGDATAAIAWGIVYAGLLGLILGPLGVLAGVAAGIVAYLGWTRGWHVLGWRA
jgi:hypothetical protein